MYLGEQLPFDFGDSIDSFDSSNGEFLFAVGKDMFVHAKFRSSTLAPFLKRVILFRRAFLTVLLL